MPPAGMRGLAEPLFQSTSVFLHTGLKFPVHRGLALCPLMTSGGDRNRKQEMVVSRTNDWYSDFSFSGYMVRVYYPPFEGECG